MIGIYYKNMRQSKLFSKTSKTSSSSAQSANHDLLLRAGFVDQTMSGVYSYLPLGVIVLEKISNIVRDEMQKLGAQEVLLPALHPKENWKKTGRWDSVDVLFKIDSQTGSKYALGPTHEEIIVPLAKKFISSYRDLPIALYQIQSKFRDELRAKSGLLRGREFLMKDLYSFHSSRQDLKDYYEKVKTSYLKIFSRCGLDAIITEASGGSFTKDFSHEFQVKTESGEDIVYYCPCSFARNKEISEFKAGDKCPKCSKELLEIKTIEVGNIFDLGTKFSNDFELVFADEEGGRKMVFIGCYGIGISRIMGAIVEVSHDDKGIIWPKEVSPFDYHLLSLSDDVEVFEKSEKIYNELTKKEKRVLWDDRTGVSNAEKLSDADLIGISQRLVVSPKTAGKIESKARGGEAESILVEVEDLF